MRHPPIAILSTEDHKKVMEVFDKHSAGKMTKEEAFAFLKNKLGHLISDNGLIRMLDTWKLYT